MICKLSTESAWPLSHSRHAPSMTQMTMREPDAGAACARASTQCSRAAWPQRGHAGLPGSSPAARPQGVACGQVLVAGRPVHGPDGPIHSIIYPRPLWRPPVLAGHFTSDHANSQSPVQRTQVAAHSVLQLAVHYTSETARTGAWQADQACGLCGPVCLVVEPSERAAAPCGPPCGCPLSSLAPPPSAVLANSAFPSDQ